MEFTTEQLRLIYSVFGNKAAPFAVKAKQGVPEAVRQYMRYKEIERIAYMEVIERNNKTS